MDLQQGSTQEEISHARATASLLSTTDDGLHHGMGDMTLTLGDYVVLNSGQTGVIRFIGPTSFSTGEWIGVELDEANGKNDGSVRGTRYFDCRPNHGMFLRRSALARGRPASPVTSDRPVRASMETTIRPSLSGRASTASVSSPGSCAAFLSSNTAPRPDEFLQPSMKKPCKDKMKKGSSKLSSSPRVDSEASSDLALLALRQELADASEDHDLDRLRWIVPVACKAGVPPVELDAARHILQYETLHHLPPRAEGGDAEGDARNTTSLESSIRIDDKLLSAIREELESTSTVIRSQMVQIVEVLRQDFAILRGEFRAVSLSGNITNDVNSQASVTAVASGSQLKKEETSKDVTQGKVVDKTLLVTDAFDSKENIAAKRLLAVVKGGAERREQRRREAAVNVIQRCVRRLKNRWSANLEKQKACSFAAVAHAARDRNKEWALVFDRCRQGQDGLKQESFVKAMQLLLPRLTTPQSEALFKAYIKGTQKLFLDFRSLARMLEATHTSDRSAAEFADMTLEDWKALEQPHVVKTKFTKHRGGGHSRASIFQQPEPVRRSVLEREMRIECPSLDFNPEFPIYNIDLHEAGRQQNIQLYYKICRESPGLLVTTSCFTIWRKHNKTNGYAKLIPAVPMDDGSQSNHVRIFFFDDNLDMNGGEESFGICNLRDIRTGDFIDFSAGKNGFQSEQVSRHTIIHRSDMYRNVLIKANILDAIADKDYFSSIITKYSKPDEKVIIFMDVNSTIVCNDTVQGKDSRGTLLSTMFEFMELQPKNACDFVWDGSPAIRLEKPMLLRSLVKELTKASAQSYSEFWKEATCLKLLDDLMPLADLRWCLHEGCLTREKFNELYSDYAASIEKDVNKEGITSSWFECFNQMKANHTVVLNSFGVDTQKVIIATGLDETKVLQIAVNYDLWDARDKQKFETLFKSKDSAS